MKKIIKNILSLIAMVGLVAASYVTATQAGSAQNKAYTISKMAK